MAAKRDSDFSLPPSKRYAATAGSAAAAAGNAVPHSSSEASGGSRERMRGQPFTPPPAANAEELSLTVLKFQNRKVAVRLRMREKVGGQTDADVRCGKWRWAWLTRPLRDHLSPPGLLPTGSRGLPRPGRSRREKGRGCSGDLVSALPLLGRGVCVFGVGSTQTTNKLSYPPPPSGR